MILETVLPLGAIWVIGWLKKHKTKLDHKTWGPFVNVAIGSAVGVAMGGESPSLGSIKDGVIEGVKLAAMAELGLAGTKSAVRLSRVARKKPADGGS